MGMSVFPTPKAIMSQTTAPTDTDALWLDTDAPAELGPIGETGPTGPAGPNGDDGSALSLNLSLIASGSLNSGTSLNIPSLTQDTVQIHLYGLSTVGGTRILIRPNNSSSSVYNYLTVSQRASAGIHVSTQNGTSFDLNGEKITEANTALNYFIITLTNCKAAGFTTFDALTAFNSVGPQANTAWTKGIYRQSEQITSVTITTSTGTSFNGTGTYNIFGG
jgi:hypothetical protein